jgi:polyisoprenoid-binding protein YceI
MKKALIIVVIIAAALLLWKYASDKRSQSTMTETSVSTPGFQSNRESSPGADENGTYTIDTRASSVIIGDVVVPVKNGTIVFQSGSIVGDAAFMNLSNLKNSKSFDPKTVHLEKNDGTLNLKALVFDRANSTNEHVVFRTDAELTINGITKPVSLSSTFQYRPGYVVISGSTNPDWSAWGLTPVGAQSALSVTLVASK